MNAIAALSPYSSSAGKANSERHTLSVLVDNEPGVLARVVGLFSGRGYNIESLTVSETQHEKHISRITIVTSGPPEAIEQIGHQLERLVPVHHVIDLTMAKKSIERELAMVRSPLDGVVVDIGRAHDALKATLGPLNYQNLDELPQFAGKQTTTEYLSKYIFDAMAGAARSGALGPGGEGICKIRVNLHESHVARAWYEGAV
jgi:acetolactate synthase small subunit